ncbi:MAG: hypothetical protein IJ529_04920 [Alphaproteobacteria bacterium]|nr:hypothetical protein [Alphaproteobacteria bacterium]
MKKTIFLYLGAAVLLAGVVKADFEDIVLDKTRQSAEELRFSSRFLTALAQCSPYQEQRNFMGLAVNYKIEGYNKDNLCQMTAQGESGGMQTITTCLFDNATRERFINAQKALRHLFERAKSMQEIMTDDNYITATALMMNPQICTSRRLEFDPTKELRAHLQDCSPYQYQIPLLNQGVVTMQINGLSEDKCDYRYNMQLKAPDESELKKMYGDEMYAEIKDYITDISNTIHCRFTDYSREKYIRLLEQTIIPAGDGFDMDDIKDKADFNKQILEYLGNNPECETLAE